MNTILSDDGSEFVRFRIINNSILINVTSQMYDQLNFGLGTTSAIETEIAGNEVFLKIELPVLSDTTSTKLPDIVKLNLIVKTLSLLTAKIAQVYKNLKVEEKHYFTLSTKPQLLFFAIQPSETSGYKINLELSDSLTNNLNNHLGERFGCREKWLLRKYCRMTANSDDEVKRKLSDRNTDLAIGMGKKGILRIGIPSDQGDTTFMQICPSLDKQKNWYHCQLNSSLETTMMILAIIQFTRKIEEAMQIQYMII